MFFYRIVFALLLLFVVVMLPAWVYFLLGAVLAFRYTAYEFVIISLLVDMYFGLGGWPVYFMVSFVLVFLIEFSKPHISMYTNDNV